VQLILIRVDLCTKNFVRFVDEHTATVQRDTALVVSTQRSFFLRFLEFLNRLRIWGRVRRVSYRSLRHRDLVQLLIHRCHKAPLSGLHLYSCMGSGCNSINPASTGVASIKACASARTIRPAVIRHASSGAIVNKQFYSQVRRSVNERVLQCRNLLSKDGNDKLIMLNCYLSNRYVRAHKVLDSWDGRCLCKPVVCRVLCVNRHAVSTPSPLIYTDSCENYQLANRQPPRGVRPYGSPMI
jgi:hypothetical protein